MADNFKSLQFNKDTFIKELAYDVDLAKCLLCSDRNFKDYALIEEQMDDLAYTHIFPCMSTLGVALTTGSYILMAFTYKKNGTKFKDCKVYFQVFCHKSIIRTDYGVSRYDYILQQLDRIINNTDALQWLGKLQFLEAKDFKRDEDYLGIEAVYVTTEYQ